MTYFLVDAENNKFRMRCDDVRFDSETTAKRMRTRYIREGKMDPKFNVKSAEQFHKDDTMVEKTNLMTGKPFMIAKSTPRCCDPSTELYWSM